MVIGLCDRFKKLPSELEDEDADLIRMLEIMRLGGSEGKGGAPDVE